MNEDFFEEEESKEWVRQYEHMLQTNQYCYLDVEAYEYIINHYLAANEIDSARKACEIALATYPYTTEILVDYAHVLATTGESKSAMEVIKRAETFHPHDIDLVVLKSVLLNQEGKHKEVLEYLMEMEPLVEEKEKLYFAMGATLQQMERYEEAMRWYKKGLLIDHKNEDALNELLFCHEMTGGKHDSRPFFQKLIDKDPFSQIAWLHYGYHLNDMKAYNEALEAFDYAMAIKHNVIEPYAAKGDVYMNTHQYEKAIDVLTEGLRYDEKNTDVLVSLGAAYEQCEKYDRAIHYYRMAIKYDHRHANAYYGLGNCLMEMEKYSEALHFYNKAIAYDPEQSNVNFWLGKAQAEYEIGNLASAIEAYEKVFEIYSALPELWLDWSFIYYELGDYDRAISLICSGIEELPDNAELYYQAVAYMITAGLLKEALIYLENALLLDYEMHTMLFEFFEDDLQVQKAIFKLVKHFTNKRDSDQ